MHQSRDRRMGWAEASRTRAQNQSHWDHNLGIGCLCQKNHPLCLGSVFAMDWESDALRW
jgi:hypothetical protein